MQTRMYQLRGTQDIGQPDPDALISASEFVCYVENIEKAFPSDTPAEVLTRIRVTYYGMEGKTFGDRFKNDIAFRQLIPDARIKDVDSKGFLPLGSAPTTPLPKRFLPTTNPPSLTGPQLAWRSIWRSDRVDSNTLKHLSARADENTPYTGEHQDNPSPYIVMPDGSQVDAGHLLLGLDALQHPRTSSPFSDYGIPNIDPATYVADLGLAVVWMTQHQKNGASPIESGSKMKSPSLKEYLNISAPPEDILGDVDSFGMFREMGSQGKRKLSQALRSYYLGDAGEEPGVTRRWQTFCQENGFNYSITRASRRTGPVKSVQWDHAVRTTLISRIDRFNDLAASGSISGMIDAAKKRIFDSTIKRNAWQHTPAAVDWFLNVVADGLKKELSKS